MLSTVVVGLAIKVAKGLIKITSRIDVMLADEETVTPAPFPLLKSDCLPHNRACEVPSQALE